jgi:hypothetical protein
MSLQLFRQEGVAPLAASGTAAPTPPARVIVAATAKTLLFIDMGYFLLRPVGRALRPADARGPLRKDSGGLQ